MRVCVRACVRVCVCVFARVYSLSVEVNLLRLLPNKPGSKVTEHRRVAERERLRGAEDEWRREGKEPRKKERKERELKG